MSQGDGVGANTIISYTCNIISYKIGARLHA
jgi:hypothetical protein